MEMNRIIEKVSKYFSYGYPVAQGHVYYQKSTDARLKVKSHFICAKELKDQPGWFHEVWLSIGLDFVVTHANYPRDLYVSRSIISERLSFKQLCTQYPHMEMEVKNYLESALISLIGQQK